jgi:hypothetical protein
MEQMGTSATNLPRALFSTLRVATMASCSTPTPIKKETNMRRATKFAKNLMTSALPLPAIQLLQMKMESERLWLVEI